MTDTIGIRMSHGIRGRGTRHDTTIRGNEMEAVTIPVVVGADRRLVIDLPPSTPIGPADVLILPRANGSDEMRRLAREAARARLLAADFLTTDIHAPVGTVPLSDEELEHLGHLPGDARPSEVLVDEDRGTY